MAANRLVILLAIFVILTILLLQNWSPALSLTFLGMKTQPLPLAIWIVLSLAAGAVTSWLIGTLYQLSSYLGSPKQPTSPRPSYRRPSVQADMREEVSFKTDTASKTTPQPEPRTRFVEDEDDWDTDGVNEDWDFEEYSKNQKIQDSPQEPRQQYRDYEPPSPPKRNNQADSAYSYSYREPKNTGVGKTESVYDADYRVIIPPYQPPEKSPPVDEDDDDWSFFEDEEEDFDDDDDVSQSSPKRDR